MFSCFVVFVVGCFYYFFLSVPGSSIVGYIFPVQSYHILLFIVYRQSLSARSAMCPTVAFSPVCYPMVLSSTKIIFVTSCSRIDLNVDDFYPVPIPELTVRRNFFIRFVDLLTEYLITDYHCFSSLDRDVVQ